MALDVDTDDNNDKTEKNDQKYVHTKRTRDGTYVLFCVLTSLVLTDNKCILSCAVILNESNEEQNETVRGIYISQFLFRFFPSRLCNQSRDNLELLPFIFGGPK